MAEECAEHGFKHFSPKNYIISAVHAPYYTNIVSKFTIEGVTKYGRLRSRVNNLDNIYQYAFEMDMECASGYSKTDSATFECNDRRGVLISDEALLCTKSGIHETLNLFFNKTVDFENICCISSATKLMTLPNLLIGWRCVLRKNHLKSYVGIIKWMGKINNIECVGVEMTTWMSSECNGFCHGFKVFDCRNGYGVFIQACDIEINPKLLEINQNNFIDLKNYYHIERQSNSLSKEMLKIGSRVEVLYIEKKYYGIYNNKFIFGEIKWIGKIDDDLCFGVELDYRCEGGMDGIISTSESFKCTQGHGAICHLNSVSFDYYIYSTSFTVTEAFNLDNDLIYKEDWNQATVEEKNLKVNNNIYVYIKKSDRILDIKGILKWFGLIQGVLVGILEMPEDFPINNQQMIIKILKDVKAVAYIAVHSQYLFKYKTLKPYEYNENELIDFELGSKTEFGIVKWRGCDNTDQLYYGFEQEVSSECGTDGTFYGQSLFSCSDGLGVIISAKTIKESFSMKPRKSLCQSNIPKVEEIGADVEFILKVLDINEESCDKLLNEAMIKSNKKLMLYFIKSYPQWINMCKYPLIMTELKIMGLKERLIEVTEKCVLKGKDDEELLNLATDALKNEYFDLFLKVIEECTEKNMVMKNGETFLTNIIKEDFPTKSIIMAIKTNKFNATTPNNKNETPLNLVCTKKMTGVVEPLMLSITNQSQLQMICTICMDKNVSIVFNCGHNSCKECSDKIVNCHFCSEGITTRGPLFLNN